MQQPVTPPPFYGFQKPVEKKPSVNYGTKVVILGLQALVLMIAALMVWAMTYSRQSSNREVAESIASQWGERVYINGPQAITGVDSASQTIAPQRFDCTASVESQSLHRGIYEAEVFNANIKMSGSFSRSSLTGSDDSVKISVQLPAKQIYRMGSLHIGGDELLWSKSRDSIYAVVSLKDLPETVLFSTDFDIHGSEALFINPLTEESSITIEGDASNPSFSGSVLPDDRSVNNNRFSATWGGRFSATVENTDPSAYDCEYITDYSVKNGREGYVGSRFLIGVDRYQKVTRAIKYAFIIIILTYISVLLIEILLRRPIPLINYFLVGAALVLFYSLLLSFVEHIAFGYAYTLAAFMTIALIAAYLWKMLDSRKVGFTIGALLTVIYTSCYVLLCVSSYALLLGSLLMFAALAGMMYASLRINKPH